MHTSPPASETQQANLFEVSQEGQSAFQIPASLSIVGISKSGQAAARLAVARGVRSILLSDDNPKASLTDDTLASQLKIEVGYHEALWHHAEHVVLSPGIPPHSELVFRLQQGGFTLWSEPDWAFLNQPPHVRSWITVTGTNGKSTITSLVAHILNHLHPSIHAVACGNIGLAVSEVIQSALTDTQAIQPVVELSSYQLHYSTTLAPEIGIFSNLTPDHLAWHGGLNAYAEAKGKLFIGDLACRYAVINLDDPLGMQWATHRSGSHTLGIHSKPHALAGLPVPQLFVNSQGMIELFIPPELAEDLRHLQGFNALRLPRSAYVEQGGHHTQNALLGLGAVLWYAFWDESPFASEHALPLQEAFRSFKGLAHRFQRLDVPHPFQAINDSKATNPEAGMAALNGLAPDEKAILLVGGRAKKTPLHDWARLASEKASVIYCYGEDAHDFVEALKRFASSVPNVATPYFEVETLDEAVALALAFQQENPEAVLLLAPACASQDAFTDFEHRGRYFEALVLEFFKTKSLT